MAPPLQIADDQTSGHSLVFNIVISLIDVVLSKKNDYNWV
jgi:hypothetical protein